MMTAANYQVQKLPVENPDLVNLAILASLLLVYALSLRKSPGGLEFLGKEQTNQLKGFGIALVVLGHMWWHIAATRAEFIFSGDAVALFYLLSGFGLSLSVAGGRPTLTHYAGRRIRRVMVPYWLATIVLVVADGCLLGKTYPNKDLILTFLGINVSPVTIQIDYVRWYITLLLLWYAAFYLSLVMAARWQLTFLIGCGTLLFLWDYFGSAFFWYQVYAFPAGVAIAHYRESCRALVARFPRQCALGAVAGFAVYLASSGCRLQLLSALPTVLGKVFSEALSIVLCTGGIVGIASMGFKGYASPVFGYVGRFSYGIFLLHGALLVKYNPFIQSGGGARLFLEFWVFLMAVIALGAGFGRAAEWINDKT